MIINKKIIEIFKPLKIPCVFMEYNGQAERYLVFSTTNQANSEFADDNAMAEKINVGLNYFYKKPEDMMLIEEINKVLKDNNFSIASQRDIHKNGTDFYNRSFYLEYKNNFEI
ncbi:MULTISPECIES: hypothetical protein [Clostridium]|jgi:hypothetical protein|uniref:hypothetical protein n=1 Tax=Clostridium TaxID=1485 RepID=UPI000509CBC4|nr:hypothetical protein [Clostridium saudiense]